MEFLRLRLKLSWTKPGVCLWAFMFRYLGEFGVFGARNPSFDLPNH